MYKETHNEDGDPRTGTGPPGGKTTKDSLDDGDHLCTLRIPVQPGPSIATRPVLIALPGYTSASH
jgi:hypothetical protein